MVAFCTVLTASCALYAVGYAVWKPVTPFFTTGCQIDPQCPPGSKPVIFPELDSEPQRHPEVFYRSIDTHLLLIPPSAWLFPFPSSALSDFTYEPLETTTESIRVVRILPNDDSAIIHLELQHQPLHSTGYVCLSYIWGVPRPPEVILVNSRRLAVQWNLWQFLRYARRAGINDWLWIDAISINQFNVTERNEQVQQMDYIYRTARHVVIWAQNMPHYSDSPVQEQCGAFSEGANMSTCVKDISMSEYWTRLWILQELDLVQDLYLLIGRTLVPYQAFLEARWEVWCEQPDLSDTAYDLISRRLSQKLMERRLPEDAYFLVTDTEDKMKLSRKLNCSDGRDHWYGMLGLLGPVKNRFPVDYEIDAISLIFKAIEHLVAGRDYDVARGAIHMLTGPQNLRALSMCHPCAIEHVGRGQDLLPIVIDTCTIPEPETIYYNSNGCRWKKIMPVLLVILTEEEFNRWDMSALDPCAQKRLRDYDPSGDEDSFTHCAVCQCRIMYRGDRNPVSATRVGQEQMWLMMDPDYYWPWAKDLPHEPCHWCR